MWSSLVLSMIRGNKMDDFILGTKSDPDIFIFEGDKQKMNPKFEEWVTLDQLLLGLLYNSMTLEVISQVLGCKTLQELWNVVKEFSGSQTWLRVTLYKSELQGLRKGGLKMDEYL